MGPHVAAAPSKTQGVIQMPQNNPTTSGFPLRTKEQILASGGSLATEPSCAPPVDVSGDRTVLGCQGYPVCRFGNPAFGTFKDHGPELIAYFLKTIEGNEKTDQIICHGFINSLQAAMDDGISGALAGRRHEIVKIIAHRGEKYRTLVRSRIVDAKTKEVSLSEPKLVERTVGEVSNPMESQALSEYRGELSAEYLGVLADTIPAAKA
jgi:hypothetical protein